MAASVRSSEVTNITSESTSWELKRGTVSEGDLIYAFFFPRRTAGLSVSEAPSGFTLVTSLQTGVESGFCYVKTAGGSEGEKYKFVLSQVETGQGCIIVAKEAVGVASSAAANTTGTSHAAGAVNTSGPNLILAVHSIDGASPTFTGAGTELIDSPQGGIPSALAAYSDTAAAEEAYTHTGTSSGAGEGVSIALAVYGAGEAPTFPEVKTTAETAVTTAGTSHAITLPSGIKKDDLILILTDKGSTAATFNEKAGWTELVDENAGNGITMWARDADETEGASVTFTSSASTRSASIAFRISGAEKVANQKPELSTVATGTSTGADPGTCTPTGGEKTYLWIAMCGYAGEEADDDTWANTPPTNFTPSPPLQKSCGTAGVNLGGLIAAAYRQKKASSEDPGAFNVDVSAAWRAFTIAVHPLKTGETKKVTLEQGTETDAAQAITGKKLVTTGQGTETDTGQVIKITHKMSITLAQALETDAAQAIAKKKLVLLAQASETDAAQALKITHKRSFTLEQGIETDAAQPVTKVKRVTLVPIAETDTALAPKITHKMSFTLSPASETDTTRALAATLHRTLGQGLEADSAVGVTRRKLLTVTPATETDVAQALTRLKKVGLGQGSESDSALALSRAHRLELTPATEADTAQAIAAHKRVTIVPASEADSARALSAIKRLSPGIAVETDAAQAVIHKQRVTLTPATETDAAQAISALKKVKFTPATETDAAQAVTHKKVRTLTPATETDAAQIVHMLKRVSMTPALETDEARTLTHGAGKAIFVELPSFLTISGAGAALTVEYKPVVIAIETDPTALMIEDASTDLATEDHDSDLLIEDHPSDLTTQPGKR